MKNGEMASISIMKIVCVSIILVLISGIGVMAVNTNLNDVKIILNNGYELTVLTTKTSVKDILDENNVIVDENMKTIPELDAEVMSGSVIKIVDKSYNEIQVSKVSEEGLKTTIDELLTNYAPIVEKIVKEQVSIPYETITKNTLGTTEDTTNKIIQRGQDGIKEITYKVKYKNDEEIEKTQLSEQIIKEPVNKIVQVVKNETTRSAIMTRETTPATAEVPANATIYKITAYCSCAKCCGKTNGITAMGTLATAGRTVAAPSRFAFGTKLNINGKIYTVEDRGGAITGNKIDMYVNSHAEALAWGVKYLPVSVVE